MTLKDVSKSDKLKDYPVSWSLSRSSTALTMQYKEVQVNEPCYERVQESPMAFQDVLPYVSTLNDTTIRPTYADVVASLKALDTANTNVIYEDASRIAGGTVLPSALEMGTLRINDDGNKPIVCLHTATHGGENHSYHGVIEFINHYLSSTDELSVWMRNNISLFWIAIPNPDGFMINERRNANNINLNRNWGYFWDYSADPDKGVSALSEIENKNTDNFLTIDRKSRIISFLDIHGWFSRTTYGFLTDQIWDGDIRAYKQQRASYLYMKSIMEKRDWNTQFTIANAQPTPVERRSSRKPYISYALRREFRPDAWSGQFEYTHNENVGVGGTSVLDAITGVVMSARDTLAAERVGIVCAPEILSAEVVNNNSHFTQAWNFTDNRPPWFNYNNLAVQNNVLPNPHYTETSIVINRPDSSSWPYAFNNGGVTVHYDPLLDSKGYIFTAGGETQLGYSSKFYAEELQPPPPPAIGDNMFGIYKPSLVQISLPSLPYAAKGIQIVNDGTYIYAFGGYNGVYQDKIYKILISGIETNSWELAHTVAFYGEGLNRHRMNYWNGKLVITGGRTSVGYRSETLIIDIATWSETVLKKTNGIDDFFSARGWHSTVIVGDDIWVIGGWTGSTTLLSVYKYNLISSVSSYIPMQFSRRQASAVYSATDNKIYIFGGCAGSTTTPDYLAPYAYDLTLSQWENVTYELDSFVDEDGNTVTIPPPDKKLPLLALNPVSEELLLIGGGNTTSDFNSDVYVIDTSSDYVSRRKTNDVRWGYIRPNSVFSAISGEVYVATMAVRRLDPTSGINAYIRPSIYVGDWGEPMRKVRLGYSVPPDNGWHVYSVPVQVHTGFTGKVRSYIRHYGSGTRLLVGAMQITKNHLHGVIVPEGGKSSDILTAIFNEPISGNNSIDGVFSPMWGSQQATNGEITVLSFNVDVMSQLNSMSLTFEATADGNYLDLTTYSDFSANGNFRLRWNIDGVDYSYVFPTIELNHDRFAPAWRKDVVHWRLRSENNAWHFDLWFYNKIFTASLGTMASNVKGFTANGSGIVSKVG